MVMFDASKQKIRLLIGDRFSIRRLPTVRCFWTWPFGHVWGKHASDCSYDRQCAICRRESSKGSSGGGWMYDIMRHCYSVDRIAKHYIISTIVIFLTAIGIALCF